MKYTGIIIFLLAAFSQGCYYDKDLINPNAICDTTTVTYSGSVKPILTAYCTGCHSGPNAPSNIKLDAHASVKVVADNKKLLGTINHTAGFSPMPKNGTKLSECNIAKIRKWVTTGAPNN